MSLKVGRSRIVLFFGSKFQGYQTDHLSTTPLGLCHKLKMHCGGSTLKENTMSHQERMAT